MSLYRTIPDNAINNSNKSSLPIYLNNANEVLQAQQTSGQTYRYIRQNEINVMSGNKHVKCIKDSSKTYYECVEWNFFPINCTMNVDNSLKAIFRVYSTTTALSSTSEVPSQPDVSFGSNIQSAVVNHLNQGVYTITVTAKSSINNSNWSGSNSYIEVKNTYGLRFRIYALPKTYIPMYIAVNGWTNINNSNNGKFYFVVNDEAETSNYDSDYDPNCLLLHKFIQGYDFAKLSSIINASYVGYDGSDISSSTNQLIFSFGYRTSNQEGNWHLIDDTITLNQSPSKTQTYKILFPFHILIDQNLNSTLNTWTSSNDTTQPMFYVNENDSTRQIKYIYEDAAEYSSTQHIVNPMLHVYFKTNNGSVKRIYDYQRLNNNYSDATGNTIESSYEIGNKNGLTFHFGKLGSHETIQIQTGIS